MTVKRKTPFQVILDKVKETKGFKVEKPRGTIRQVKVTARLLGSQTFTYGSPDTTNQRIWESKLRKLGWTHEKWEASISKSDSDAPETTAGERGDEPVTENGMPVVTVSVEEMYRIANQKIADCDMYMEYMAIGPREAQILLDDHREAAEARGKDAGLTDGPLPLDAPDAIVQQRKVKEASVDRYERLMRNQLWELIPDGLAIGPDGWLGNGSHRVQAVQRSGCVVAFTVFHNVPDSAFPYIDRGTPRSDVDLLTMRGKTNDPQLPSVLKLLWLYDNLPYIDEWRHRGRTPNGDELFQYAAKHYVGIEEHLKACASFNGKKPLTKTSATALRYVILRDNPAAPIDDFLNQVLKPHNVSDAAFVLSRHGESRYAQGKQITQDRMELSHWLFLVGLWTWDHFIKGSQLKVMRWKPSAGITKLPEITA